MWHRAVSDDCMRFGFAKTLCLSLGPSQDSSSKQRFETASSLLCSELFWASSDHHKNCSSTSSHHALSGVKNNCVSGFATFSPSCDESCTPYGRQIERTSSMEYKLLPIRRYENAAQHLWFNHFSFCVSLNGSNVQGFMAKNLTILESRLVASFPDEADPIFVTEIDSSITLESEFELWTFGVPMNCPFCMCRTNLLTN